MEKSYALSSFCPACCKTICIRLNGPYQHTKSIDYSSYLNVQTHWTCVRTCICFERDDIKIPMATSDTFRRRDDLSSICRTSLAYFSVCSHANHSLSSNREMKIKQSFPGEMWSAAPDSAWRSFKANTIKPQYWRLCRSHHKSQSWCADARLLLHIPHWGRDIIVMQTTSRHKTRTIK